MGTTDAITPDDHSGYVSVTAALFLSWSLSTLAVRSWIRLRLHGPWGLDDSLITLATFFAICQAAAMFVAVHHDYGLKYPKMPKANIPPAEKALYAGEILYVASICASKLSTSFLVARLTRLRSHIRASYAISIFTLAWGFCSIIVVAVRGDLSQPWTTLDGQEEMFHRWLGIEIISMLIEIALYGLSIFLVWGLQMSRVIKGVILAAFACRLVIIPITCVRLYYLLPSLNLDLSFDTVHLEIVTQVVLHFTLIAATIPCTKPFMRPFNSGYVSSYEEGGPSPCRSHSGGNGYILSGSKRDESDPEGATGGGVLRSKGSKTGSAWSREKIRSYGDSDFRPDKNTMSTVESKRASGFNDIRGTEMKKFRPNEMVIRQTTEWDVQREPASRP